MTQNPKIQIKLPTKSLQIRGLRNTSDFLSFPYHYGRPRSISGYFHVGFVASWVRSFYQDKICLACHHFVNTLHSVIIKVLLTWAICCVSTKGHRHLDPTVKDVRLVRMAYVSCWISGNIRSAVLTATLQDFCICQ